MTIQQAETEFYEIFPTVQNQMIKVAECYDARNLSGMKVPLEAYKVTKTYAKAQTLVTRQVKNGTVYYDAYPGELISVVADPSASLNGVYMVMGTQDQSAQGLSLRRLAFADE